MAKYIQDTRVLYSHFRKCKNVCTDTRKIEKGSLFFCLKGENFDGNKFAQEAIEKGALYVVIDNPEFDFGEHCLLVDNSLIALQKLAKYHRLTFSIPILGITGTNGKTTTKELIHCVLAKKYKTHATSGNFNNHIGVPLTLLSMHDDTELAIIEMGANHIGEIAELCAIAQPDFGLITSIGKAHLEGFGSIEGVIKTKKELYDFVEEYGKMLFVPAENELLMDISASIKRVTYGSNTNADYYGKVLENIGLLKIAYQSFEIQSQLVGDYNFINLMAAISVGKYFGVVDEDIVDALESYAPQNQRSQLIKGKTNTIILDAYNANPTSMELALKNLNQIQTSQKSVVLGDMLELGTESIAEHKAIIEVLLKMELHHCILIGPVFNSLTHPFLSFENSNLALDYLTKHPIVNEFILVKGSRGIQVEKVLAAIEQ